MASTIRFKVKPRNAAQGARMTRRRASQHHASHNTDLNGQLLDDLQRTINTQMNSIIGALEMMRPGDLASDQSEMIHVAQNCADNLLLEVDHLLASTQNFNASTSVEAASNAITNVRILLLHADSGERSRIETKLLQRAARVDSFEQSKNALAALEKAASDGDPYRIVLLDQNVTEVNGETLGIAISNSPLHRDTLIVLISDAHNRNDADRLALAGFSAWLPKPTSSTMLINTVNMLCACLVKKDAPRFVCAGVRRNTSSTGNAESLPSFTHTRILAVDDNAVNLQVAKQMLTRFGCHVETTSSGQQALQMLHGQHYDLVLMDCQMPEMDGYQTTALLRAMESADSHTIIIGWSADSRHNGRDTCLAIGMDDFIAKPIRLRSLNEILTRWLPPANTTTTMQQQDDELDATQQMFGDDFAELAQLFLGDSPKRLVLLNTAITEQDAISTGRLAHILCGSTASIGATALAALCRDLEIKAKNNELDDAVSRLNAIEVEYARIDAKLHAMLNATAHIASSGLRGKH